MTKKILLIAVFLAGILAISGCTSRDNGTSPPPAAPPAAASPATCTALGGFVCDSTETCGGTWLEASDSFSCCSQVCESSSDEILTIDEFDSGPEDEGFGEAV